MITKRHQKREAKVNRLSGIRTKGCHIGIPKESLPTNLHKPDRHSRCSNPISQRTSGNTQTKARNKVRQSHTSKNTPSRFLFGSGGARHRSMFSFLNASSGKVLGADWYLFPALANSWPKPNPKNYWKQPSYKQKVIIKASMKSIRSYIGISLQRSNTKSYN